MGGLKKRKPAACAAFESGPDHTLAPVLSTGRGADLRRTQHAPELTVRKTRGEPAAKSLSVGSGEHEVLDQ